MAGLSPEAKKRIKEEEKQFVKEESYRRRVRMVERNKHAAKSSLGCLLVFLIILLVIAVYVFGVM